MLVYIGKIEDESPLNRVQLWHAPPSSLCVCVCVGGGGGGELKILEKYLLGGSEFFFVGEVVLLWGSNFLVLFCFLFFVGGEDFEGKFKIT